MWPTGRHIININPAKTPGLQSKQGGLKLYTVIKTTKLCLLLLSIQLFFAGCNPKLNQKYNPEAASINAKLGIAYLQQNRATIAKHKLLLAIKQAPYDAQVHNAIGYFFAHTGEPKLAENHYLYALKYAKEKAFIWHNYGSFLYQQNRYKEALQYFLLAARDANSLFEARAYACASNAASKLKKDNLAKQYRQEALLHDPEIYKN
jgi:type IV pilus assembly protein PilF